MASIIWEPNVSKIVYGELIEESIFSARAIYQDADGDDYSPDGTYVYRYSGTASGTLTSGLKLAAGSYTLTITFDPTDAASGSNITGTASLTVEKATPVVVWNNPPNIKYTYDGDSGPKLSDEQLDAIADVAGAFTYSPVTDTELNTGSQTVTATFTPSDTDNYKSLPAGGNDLKIEFEVLKGEIQIVWPIFENGLCQEIRKKGKDAEIIPYVLGFPDAKAKNLGNEIPGSFSYDPSEGSELFESTDITATFTPSSGASNWVSSEMVVPLTVYKRISGPDIAPTMFGCYVQSVSSSVGWGGGSSTCSLTLVEDPENGFVWTPPEVGAACYFKYKGFYFGGVFVRWSYSKGVSGRVYQIVLESPAKLLDGIQVIMDGFEGTEYNFGAIPEGKDTTSTNEIGNYNRFRPSSQNPNITTEVNNVYNAFGHYENFTFGGLFGRANTNSAGFEANKLLETIELLSCPDENPTANFAHRCEFGPQEYYKIDLSEIKDIVPDFYRISGVTQSLNGIISDCTELVQFDYFVTLEKDENVGELLAPVGGEIGDDGGGQIKNPNVKIKSINKGSQPSPGVVRSLVSAFEEDDTLMSSSVGQELSSQTTQKMIIGGPASRLVTRQTQYAFPIWAKKSDSKYIFDFGSNTTGLGYSPRNSIPIWTDPFSYFSDYRATIMELRMAPNRGSWQTFKVFESVANGTYDKDPWCVDIDIDESTLKVLAAGNRGALSLASTSLKSAKKAYNKDFRENYTAEAKDYTDKIYAAVQSVASQFYGQMFAMPMPEEPGGQDNNTRWINEDQKYEATWEAVDSAYSPADKFKDVSFFDSSGRTKTFVEWTYGVNRDFSPLGGNYAGFSGDMYNQNSDQLVNIGQGVATTGCSIEKSAYFFDIGGTGYKPYVVMNAGSQIKEYDKDTTADFGLTVLADYFFNIYIPPKNYIGPGKANTQIQIPPKIVPPNSFGIAQQSNRYAWGPWIGGSLKGKTEVIIDDALVPESFGNVDGMNQAAESLANVGNAEMSASETGFVEIAEFPSYNIAERFAGSGPYVSDMSFTIDTSGFKTTYKFNTWTPQFGRLAKYNVDRISRINKSSLEFLQRERDRIEKRPFGEISQSPSDPEALAARLSGGRSDIAFSLAQIFPPTEDETGIVNVSKIPLADAAPLATEGGKFSNMGGQSEDQDITPYINKKGGGSSDTMSGIEAPNVTDEAEGDEKGILPNGQDTNPYFSPAIYGDGDDGKKAIENNDAEALIIQEDDKEPSDFSLYQLKKSGELPKMNKVRGLAAKGPMVLSGWGYDIAFNPVPNNGEDLRKFDPKFMGNRKHLKTGPVRLLWDEERQIWSGGPEVICGILNSEITAPSDPLRPTTFTIRVLRKVKNDKGDDALAELDETVTCYNRDTSLSQQKGSNTWVMVIRVNYEWMPLWIGCPSG